LALSLILEGWGATARLVWSRTFGTQQRYLFVQYLKAPAAPVDFPMETQGIVLRAMTEADLRDPRVRRHEPADADRLCDAIVATRQGQVVGAAWYTDSVHPEKPWYAVVEPHLLSPAWFDANLFVLPGEKGVAWLISKHAADRLASLGVRCTVAEVGVENKRSILLMRLMGAKIVAQMSVRRCFGHTTVTVQPIDRDRGSGLAGTARPASG
jgi:hypothetical protein